MNSNYELRDLYETDYDRGYIELLSQLTKTGEISKDLFDKTFDAVSKNKDYILKVIYDKETGTIIAAGTLFIEQKFIRSCSKVGHIEDIVVDQNRRKQDLGLYIIESLVAECEKRGCYKVILNCEEEVVKFYQKCGFERKDVGMAKYYVKK